MPEIHQGFADSLHLLNETTATLCTVMNNRARIKQSYAGPIHLAVVAENLHFHKRHMESIASTPARQGGLYAGAAGLINLSYVANSKASGAILFDINAYQTLFWNLTLDKISRHETAIAFRRSFETIAEDIKAAQKLYPVSLCERFAQECHNSDTDTFKGIDDKNLLRWIQLSSKNSPEGQWMHDQKLYAHIHALAKGKAIGAITLDITNEIACDQVEKYLDGKNAPIRLLYVSNILNFMQASIRSTDFVGRKLSGNMQETAKGNLYRWMEEDGRIIECDNLARNTPLIIPAQGFRQNAPLLVHA